jgi:hypothetical protein
MVLLKLLGGRRWRTPSAVFNGIRTEPIGFRGKRSDFRVGCDGFANVRCGRYGLMVSGQERATVIGQTFIISFFTSSSFISQTFLFIKLFHVFISSWFFYSLSLSFLFCFSYLVEKEMRKEEENVLKEIYWA